MGKNKNGAGKRILKIGDQQVIAFLFVEVGYILGFFYYYNLSVCHHRKASGIAEYGTYIDVFTIHDDLVEAFFMLLQSILFYEVCNLINKKRFLPLQKINRRVFSRPKVLYNFLWFTKHRIIVVLQNKDKNISSRFSKWENLSATLSIFGLDTALM